MLVSDVGDDSGDGSGGGGWGGDGDKESIFRKKKIYLGKKCVTFTGGKKNVKVFIAKNVDNLVKLNLTNMWKKKKLKQMRTKSK